eukprot:TRINITY_DN2235_c0_g1_i2.p1 TRINITY_DN2235_c0_g1~~TRINITY_DN2235_c0_g1_i2.p1  ORF type:complete len:103 (-),score=33.97 TRINITY_DN2235_c0_g1_i2:55-342(-)
MIRRPPRSTHCISSAASDVYKRQERDNGTNYHKSAKDETEMSIMSSDETLAEDKAIPILQPNGEANKEYLKNIIKKVTIGVYLLIFLVILYEFIK